VSVDYAAWLDRLAGAASDDEMWSTLRGTPPPEGALDQAQIRERLMVVLKQRGVRSPARAADSWLATAYTHTQGGCGGPDPRATVQHPPELAFEDDILASLIDDLNALGHVGEDRACKLVYLSTTSRLLERIVSLAAKGPSAGGKSATIDRVLTFFPDEATVSLSGMSEKFLVYDERPIKHRMLVLHEAAGMSGDYASYLVRTLLSEGCLRHGTVEATSDGLKPVVVEREGPAGLITSTTQVNLHAENETRLISVPIDDTRAQTKRVMDAIAAGNGRVVDVEPWHQLQYWLTDGERRVSVPFAPELAELIPPVAVRLRRDFGAVLGLTRAHAMLHKAKRNIDEQGCIVATLDDYAAVRDLVHDLISDTIGAQVSGATRETVVAVADITAPSNVGYATTAQLVERLKIDRTAVYRRVSKAIEQGYLINDADKPGKPMQLRPGDPLPEDQVILPLRETVEERCCTVAHRSGHTQGGCV
jgi:hypothetical protein